jgi:hypothetical protein
VYWYFPIIPRLKHWFANKESELLRWLKEKHKQDVGMIRYPADATKWRNIDSQNPKFAIDLRNIRVAMSTSGLNPFMNNSMHNTWPIVLTILNLPPWLCNNWKYIMMSGLISEPQQPKNDSDTYFMPLVEDLKVLWYNDGVQVWDEHTCKYFQLKPILFVIVSDSLVACNLSGQNKKVGCGCPHCFIETDSVFERDKNNSVHILMRIGTMDTTSPGLSKKELGGGATMSRPTQPKDVGREAHNRGGIEDNYRLKSCK